MPAALSLPPAAQHAALTPAVPGHSALHALNAAYRKFSVTVDVLDRLPKTA